LFKGKISIKFCSLAIGKTRQFIHGQALLARTNAHVIQKLEKVSFQFVIARGSSVTRSGQEILICSVVKLFISKLCQKGLKPQCDPQWIKGCELLKM